MTAGMQAGKQASGQAGGHACAAFPASRSHLLPSPSGVGVMPATTMYLPLGTWASLSRTDSLTCKIERVRGSALQL